MSNKRKNKFLKICCHMIFIIYFVLLIKIVLFKYRGLIAAFENLIAGELSGFRSYINDLPGDLIDNIQVTDNSNEVSYDISDDEFDIWGDITSFDDLTVYITKITKYAQKDIYDINGDKVKTREVTGEDLEIGKHINIKGCQFNRKKRTTHILNRCGSFSMY